MVAGVLFVLPGFLAILALSVVYVTCGERALVEGVFFGLKAAVLAIVLQAVVRIGAAGAAQPRQRRARGRGLRRDLLLRGARSR